jgi:hypothetical protein
MIVSRNPTITFTHDRGPVDGLQGQGAVQRVPRGADQASHDEDARGQAMHHRPCDAI